MLQIELYQVAVLFKEEKKRPGLARFHNCSFSVGLICTMYNLCVIIWIHTGKTCSVNERAEMGWGFIKFRRQHFPQNEFLEVQIDKDRKAKSDGCWSTRGRRCIRKDTEVQRDEKGAMKQYKINLWIKLGGTQKGHSKENGSKTKLCREDEAELKVKARNRWWYLTITASKSI